MQYDLYQIDWAGVLHHHIHGNRVAHRHHLVGRTDTDIGYRTSARESECRGRAIDRIGASLVGKRLVGVDRRVDIIAAASVAKEFGVPIEIVETILTDFGNYTGR